jgi:hypothetical protein
MTWTHALARTVCGYCGIVLAKGDPCLRLTGVRDPRCRICGERMTGTRPDGAPAPPVITPAPVLPSRPLQPFVERVRRQIGLDFKARASGDTTDDHRPDEPRDDSEHRD